VLFPFEPPATDDEIRAAALQFVRKISGTTKPSKANQAACDKAVEEIFASSRALLDSLVSSGPKKDRATEIAKAREKNRIRFAKTDPPKPGTGRGVLAP
jgi:hypothetical protein